MKIDDLAQWLNPKSYSAIILITEKELEMHYHRYVEPQLAHYKPILSFFLPAGEKAKTMESCQEVWSKMLQKDIDQHALIINFGGGSISDVGGYIAACYKRGIDYINIPTTLLAMIDAAIGGKTGIDFCHVKNSVGAFHLPAAIFTVPEVLETLPQEEFYSGFGEMIKYALIADESLWFKLKSLTEINHNTIPADWIQHCAHFKESIVKQDFHDHDLRRILNFGHTIGHAFESYGFTSHILTHGHAVALGIICESWISWQRDLLTKTEFKDICSFIKQHYALPKWEKETMNQLLDFCRNDKKREGQKSNITLLNHIGYAMPNMDVSYEEIEQSLLFIQQLYND